MSKLVAILNITPDSFSDGGRYLNPDAALAAIEKYIAEGADVIDIGAESTRPGATTLAPEEEWQRLEPVLRSLGKFPVTFSIDTRHALTTRKALEYGVGWINDVSGFSDPMMIEAVKNSGCKLVVMHSLSVPADKNIVMPETADVVEEVISFAQSRIHALQAAGIDHDRIIFDPGIGFGKTAVQSLKLLESVSELNQVGVPILIGHSRKSFLSEYGHDRDKATLAISKALMAQDVAYLRIHDVAAHKHLLETA